MKTLNEVKKDRDEILRKYRSLQKRYTEFIKNCERRIKEVVNMEWSKGMEYILKEIEEIFKEEAGDKLNER
ncbi:MAG: hypothetical protein KKF56_05015 [Nanoarchaeota archaeon]|nr:hypothetical protein [Nanoarchaeota archaeon]